MWKKEGGRKDSPQAGQWRRAASLLPALRTQRQRQSCGFEASLLYRVSSRTTRATQRNPVSNSKQNKAKRKVKERKVERLTS